MFLKFFSSVTMLPSNIFTVSAAGETKLWMSENALKEKKEGTYVFFWLYPSTVKRVYILLHQ